MCALTIPSVAQAEQEVEDCTFKPTLIHKDLPAVPDKAASPGNARHFHERLYEDGPRIKQVGTFRPSNEQQLT